MLKKFILPIVGTVAGIALGASAAMAAVSAAEAAKLGAELTPLGGQKAGNADGSIPAWDGGLTSAAQAGFPNYRPGQHHPDPYASDKPLYTVTAANMSQYASKLTEGHKKLLQTYRATFKMNVYPTHRSAAAPQRIYDATKRIATTAQLAKGGNGVTNAGEGIPFAIPKEGVEIFWNHVLRYRGDVIVRQIGQAPVTASGALHHGQVPRRDHGGVQPAGSEVGELSTTPSRTSSRKPWRPRASPAKCCWCRRRSTSRSRIAAPGSTTRASAASVARRTSPSTIPAPAPTTCVRPTSSTCTTAVRSVTTGRSWARKKSSCPYNSYKLDSNTLKYTDILKKNHINPDVARYELHRVWVVDSKLKAGQSHLYSRRTLYVDEDSWHILAVDCYDSRGQLYRVQEGHVIQYYDVPALWTALETVYDLSNGRYLALGLDNEEPRSRDFTQKRTLADYQPAALQRRGVR